MSIATLPVATPRTSGSCGTVRQNPKLAAALRLAEEHELPVFPCGRDKRPLTERGFKDGCSDVEQIARWFGKWPDALVAVLTGHASGLLVVDIDPQGAGWYAAHEQRLACGRIHKTARGHHLLFRMPADADIRNSAGKVAAGVDVRGEGGYVIWWPAEGLPTVGDLADISDPPAWLVELLAASSTPGKTNGHDRDSTAARPGEILEGSRNESLTRLGGKLRRDGLSGNELEAALRAANAERCKPPLQEAEVAGIAQSLTRYEPAAPVSDAPPEITDTDLANARRLAKRHGQDLRFTPERGWYVWDGTRWAHDEKSLQVQRRMKDTATAIYDEIAGAIDQPAMFRHARRSQQKNAIDAAIWLARSEPGIPMAITDFDRDGWLFNVGNGTLNLRTGEIKPHSREDLISNLSAVQFDAGAVCPLWQGFLWRVTDGSADLTGYLRRFVGYLLVGDTSEQALHFLYGLGANGKSVFCEVLLRLLGEYALAVSPDLIMLKRHGGIPNDVARLRGIRAALMNETSQGSRFDEAKLKDLTGGDTLNARFLHQEFFDFAPTHRIVIRGNHKPAINGTDEGLWRRLRLVPFVVSIPPAEQDHGLLDKLSAELPGILNWALRGCLEWQREGLKPPGIIQEAVRQYRNESDTLGRFLEECCEVRHLGQVKSSSLYSRYREFCERAGERCIPSKDMPGEMERRGFEWKRRNASSLYLGIELREAEGRNWGPE